MTTARMPQTQAQKLQKLNVAAANDQLISFVYSGHRRMLKIETVTKDPVKTCNYQDFTVYGEELYRDGVQKPAKKAFKLYQMVGVIPVSLDTAELFMYL